MRPSRAVTVFLRALRLLSRSKVKVDYLGPDEQLSPGFPQQAAKFYSAVAEGRQKLIKSDAEFDQFQTTVSQLREETRKPVRSRVDRDLDWLIEGYSGKVIVLRNYENVLDRAEYVSALRDQLHGCQAELNALFAAHPMPRPSWGKPRPYLGQNSPVFPSLTGALGMAWVVARLDAY